MKMLLRFRWNIFSNSKQWLWAESEQIENAMKISLQTLPSRLQYAWMCFNEPKWALWSTVSYPDKTFHIFNPNYPLRPPSKSRGAWASIWDHLSVWYALYNLSSESYWTHVRSRKITLNQIILLPFYLSGSQWALSPLISPREPHWVQVLIFFEISNEPLWDQVSLQKPQRAPWSHSKLIKLL